MEVILELSGHPKANVKKVVFSDTVVVGRSKKCGLQIDSSAVSRRHCEIRVRNHAVSVIDLGSSNGTFIDALRLRPGDETPLPSGARLNVGGVRFFVQYVGAKASGVETQPPALAAIPAGDDVLLVEPDDSHELINQSNLTSDEAVAPAAEIDAEDIRGSSEEDALPAEPLVEDEPILADEPEGELLTDNAAGAKDGSKARETSFDEPIEAFDDEPDLDAMFAESAAPSPSEDTSVAEAADDDVPILEEDEDQAFSFLTDDDEPAQKKNASSKTEDSRLGDFLSQLGRD